MEYRVGLVIGKARPVRGLLTGVNASSGPPPGSPSPKPGPVVPGPQPVLVNPSPAEMKAHMESTGRRLIGVEVGGKTFVTSEVAGSSHTKLLERVGSSTAVDHTRTVIGLSPAGEIEKVSVPVSGRKPPAVTIPDAGEDVHKSSNPSGKGQQAFPRKGHIKGAELPGKPGMIRNALEALAGKDKKGPLKRIVVAILVEKLLENILSKEKREKTIKQIEDSANAVQNVIDHAQEAKEHMIGILEWTDP